MAPDNIRYFKIEGMGPGEVQEMINNGKIGNNVMKRVRGANTFRGSDVYILSGATVAVGCIFPELYDENKDHSISVWSPVTENRDDAVDRLLRNGLELVEVAA